MSAFLNAVEDELAKARAEHAPMNSAHEGWAVMVEELEEFWEEVRKRKAGRDPNRMYAELVQLAAMAARCAEDVVVPLARYVSPGTKS